MYQIQSKFKYDLHPKFEIEKFLTGGKIFLKFKDAQETKRKLCKMNNSFSYKVVRLD